MLQKEVQGGIFRKPEILNRQRHAALRYDARCLGFEFAATVNSVPLAVAEFAAAGRCFPIFFSRAGGTLSALALLGLRTGENLFVRPDGGWDAPYVPAFIRRYPFAMTRDGGRHGLCIDAASSELRDDAGEPLFMEGGANAPLLDRVMHFLQELDREMAQTRRFLAVIDELDLLQEVSVQPHGSRSHPPVTGLLAIDARRLDALPPTRAGLEAAGQLQWVQAHLQSHSTTDALVARLAARHDLELPQEATP